MQRGDKLIVKATGEEVELVTAYESRHKVVRVDVMDVKGKARRFRAGEVKVKEAVK